MSDTSDKKEKSVSFWQGLKIEFAKITWPDKESVKKQTISVLVISLVSGALIAVLDMGFQYLVDFITKL